MVWVEPKAGEQITPEELMAHCEKNMPYFMVPTYIEFASNLPMTSTQKIARHELRKIGVTENTWDRRKAGYKLKK